MITLYTESFPKQARYSFPKDLMGKFSSAFFLAVLVIGCIFLPSCGGGNPTTVAPPVAATSITITPSGPVSLETGHTQTFSATPAGGSFTFQSSNPTVLTIANNGQACAGTWNSVTAPQVCTPGSAGTAEVTATAQGVSSSPVIVYVHPPITSVSIDKVPGQPQTQRTDCLSKGIVHGPESWLFEAKAFNGTTDITGSVGPFSWQQINPGSSNIVALSTPANGAQGCQLSPQGQCLNQQIVTASVPGISQIYATASGFSSQPVSVETCRIKDISLASAGDPTGAITSFLVSSGTSTTLNATVTDIANQEVTGVPLTWNTSNPVSVGVSSTGATSTVFGGTNTVTSPAAGQGTVIASCTPPTCNAGIKPSLPIYPQAAMNFVVQSTSAPALPSAYATTTACTDPIANPSGAACTAAVVPITASSSTAPFAAGTPIALPGSPNTLLYDNNGTNAYLGVDSAKFGQQGLMVFSGSTVTQATTVPGRVLAISPDRNMVITSDTKDSPNQVFICNNCSGTSRTVTSFLINGATAAAFSPDSLKAYILAGNNLYVYSKLDPLQRISLPPTPGVVGEDVAFHPQGGFAFTATSANSILPYRTCDNAQLSSANLSTANTPLMIRALPGGDSLLVLNPPNIDLVSVTSLTATLCTGTLTTTSTSFNLGQGSFIPTQFFVSPNGATAYILGETSAGNPPTRLPLIITFNVAAQTPSVLSLSNGATPLSASLSPAGNFLFVGADDGTVHVIDTASGLDKQQVTFPFPTNELCFGPGTPATQVPLSQVQILAASQSGSTTTYSYNLISGPALKLGQSITLSQMSDGGNNGTFTIAGFGTDALGNPTFSVSNSLGVTASGQSGLGTVPISCNPDLVVVKP